MFVHFRTSTIAESLRIRAITAVTAAATVIRQVNRIICLITAHINKLMFEMLDSIMRILLPWFLVGAMGIALGSKQFVMNLRITPALNAIM